MMDPTARQNVAYLVARARENMAQCDVETVDGEAIEAILQEESTTDADKAEAVRELIEGP